MEIKSAVIRDWYKLVLWYIRVRRASKVRSSDKLGKNGWYHKELLELNSTFMYEGKT